MKRSGLIFVLPLLMLSVVPRAMRADSIVLTSQVGGVYQYGVLLDVSPNPVIIVNGQTLTFTGLSGVTGASALPETGYSSAFTPTSVTFTETGGPTYVSNPNATPLLIADLFMITSTMSTPGDVSYSIEFNLPTVSGSVIGPVQPVTSEVPEPSSMVLAGSGLLGALGAIRRRFLRFAVAQLIIDRALRGAVFS